MTTPSQPEHELGGYIITRDRSSGRIHLRDATRGGFEGCNQDDAGAYEVIGAAELERAPHESFCRRCFPERPALEDATDG